MFSAGAAIFFAGAGGEKLGVCTAPNVITQNLQGFFQ